METNESKNYKTEEEVMEQRYQKLENEAEKNGIHRDFQNRSITEVYEDVIKDQNGNIVGARASKNYFDNENVSEKWVSNASIETNDKKIQEEINGNYVTQTRKLKIENKKDNSTKELELHEKDEGDQKLRISKNGKLSKIYTYKEDGSLTIDLYDNNGQPTETCEYDKDGKCLIGPSIQTIGEDGAIHLIEDMRPIENLNEDYLANLYDDELKEFEFEGKDLKAFSGQDLGKQTLKSLEDYNTRSSIEKFMESLTKNKDKNKEDKADNKNKNDGTDRAD